MSAYGFCYHVVWYIFPCSASTDSFKPSSDWLYISAELFMTFKGPVVNMIHLPLSYVSDLLRVRSRARERQQKLPEILVFLGQLSSNVVRDICEEIPASPIHLQYSYKKTVLVQTASHFKRTRWPLYQRTVCWWCHIADPRRVKV